MRTLIKSAAVRVWAYLHAASARNAWRALAEIEATEGLEGVLRALEESHGDGASRLLQARGARIGEQVRIHRGLTLHNVERSFANLSIGSRCHVGRQVFIDLAAAVSVGERATLSMRTMIITHMSIGDSHSSAGRDMETCQPVVVEDDAYIGAGAVILPGVTIGSGAIVAAGAVVTRSLAPNTVAGGVPARAITARGNLRGASHTLEEGPIERTSD